MIRRLTAIGMLISLSGAGCVAVSSTSNCEWSNDPARPLDLQTKADQRHLTGDARIAEELAIRHADAARGHRSGHYAGPDEHRRSREQCLTAMVSAIASRHGIQPEQAADAVGRRDERLDALVRSSSRRSSACQPTASRDECSSAFSMNDGWRSSAWRQRPSSSARPA